MTASLCPDCAGTGEKHYRWGNYESTHVCRQCVGTGLRGRHRRDETMGEHA